MSEEPVIMTKKQLWMNQVASFNFEKDEDELLEEALRRGFVHQVGDDQYQINMNYPEDYPA
tara:strand:+ start:33 stop:215 length:183 start_codon:yes stop_codon:yes gene_type:complete